MSVVKTCIQIAVTEDVTAELIRILTQFIMKYHIFQDSQGSFIQNYHQPLSILLEISNPEYHKLKGRPPKQYRSVVENNHITSAVIYFIPKPHDFDAQLKNTRPITLLETVCKCVVKVVTNHLSQIFANHKVLQKGNFAGLPGGFTDVPIKMLDTVIH
ncbi:hypothetical protein RhiirC2_797776 [Rhizophagus irregularis]|uniref:Uncharacterized protein n=1 Tax=Rhizophagus irregularis TaxID=588596 RepID=A0A2N1M7F7_9GLOM|nr:hypothetical protein RhiirC2_797776 [Rhizophagus irregularis]